MTVRAEEMQAEGPKAPGEVPNGYLATRAALDPRIAACIPNALVVDCGAAARAGMKGLLKNTAFMDTAFKLIMKVNTPAR